MRILLATLGTSGDVHPFIALGLALKQRDHEMPGRPPAGSAAELNRMSRTAALAITCCAGGLVYADTAEPPPVVRAEVRWLLDVRDDYGPAQAFEGTRSLALLAARLMADPRLDDHVELESALQLETATWNLADPTLAALGADAVLVSVPHALPLEYAVARDAADRMEMRIRFDRLAVRTHAGPVSVSVGRMTHPLGVARLFPNLDVIARMPVTAPPSDYRPGIDSARLKLEAGAVAVTVIYAAAAEWAERHWHAFAPRNARAAVALTYETDRTHALLLASLLHAMPFFGAGYEHAVGALSVVGELGLGLDHDALERRPYFVLGTGGVAYRAAGVLVAIEGTYFGYGSSDPAAYPTVLAGQRLQDEDVPFLFGTVQLGAEARIPVWRERVAATTYAFLNVHDPSLYLEEQLDLTTTWGGMRLGVIVPLGARPVQRLVPNTELAFVSPSVRFETRVNFD